MNNKELAKIRLNNTYKFNLAWRKGTCKIIWIQEFAEEEFSNIYDVEIITTEKWENNDVFEWILESELILE